jgi:hypothetical protein
VALKGRHSLEAIDTMTAVAARSLSHKFQIGEDVIYTPGADDVMEKEANGRITRLLPREGADYQYHIRVEPTGPERRALENQIRPFTQADTR